MDHITLLCFVLIRACCVAKLGIVHQNVPTKDKRLLSHLASVHLVLMLWAVLFDAMRCGALVEEAEEDQDLNDTEDFVALSIKSLELFAILDGGATKTVSGFIIVQPVVDQHEEATIETTDVGLTFAGGESEAASTNIWIPHTEFPQGISVNFVSNESTLSHRFGCDP